MARTNNLTNFLSDVSSAIKQKTGDSSSIPAADFDTKILLIPAQGTYQEKQLNITQNGNFNLLPDSGYDALDQVTITTNVVPTNQAKTQTITTNTETVFTPDANYDGLSRVTITTNVPMENTADYPTCLALAQNIIGDAELIDDPYITYNVTLDVTNADQIAITNRDLVITTPSEE